MLNAPDLYWITCTYVTYYFKLELSLFCEYKDLDLDSFLLLYYEVVVEIS